MKLLLSILALSFLSLSSAHADLSYVDVKAKQTYIFFLDGSNITVATCNGLSEVKSKADCNLATSAILFDRNQATDFFVRALPSNIGNPTALSPLSLGEVTILLNAGKPAGVAAVARRQVLKTQQAQLTNLLKKYPGDATTQAELTKNQSEMSDIENTLSNGAGGNPDLVTTDFGSLVKSFITDYIAATKTTEILASVNEDTLVGALVKTMLAAPSTGKMSFVFVRPGTFQMGDKHLGDSNYDSYSWKQYRVHEVNITHAYEIQTTEVTQKQWADVMGNNPSNFKSQSYCPKNYLPDLGGICALNPVENITWEDVNSFLSKLNNISSDGYTYRLPTEAEWEYADRGGQNMIANSSAFSYGEDSSNVGNYAWYADNSGTSSYNKQTQLVGTKLPNLLGLYDMDGNVSEFVKDFYFKYSSGPDTDPTGPSSGDSDYDKGHAIRGGNFADDASRARAGFRYYVSPDSHGVGNGFRLVRTKGE